MVASGTAAALVVVRPSWESRRVVVVAVLMVVGPVVVVVSELVVVAAVGVVAALVVAVVVLVPVAFALGCSRRARQHIGVAERETALDLPPNGGKHRDDHSTSGRSRPQEHTRRRPALKGPQDTQINTHK